MKVVKKQICSYYKVPNCGVDGFVKHEEIFLKPDGALSKISGPHVAVLQRIDSQGKSQAALDYGQLDLINFF